MWGVSRMISSSCDPLRATSIVTDLSRVSKSPYRFKSVALDRFRSVSKPKGFNQSLRVRFYISLNLSRTLIRIRMRPAGVLRLTLEDNHVANKIMSNHDRFVFGKRSENQQHTA